MSTNESLPIYTICACVLLLYVIGHPNVECLPCLGSNRGCRLHRARRTTVGIKMLAATRIHRNPPATFRIISLRRYIATKPLWRERLRCLCSDVAAPIAEFDPHLESRVFLDPGCASFSGLGSYKTSFSPQRPFFCPEKQQSKGEGLSSSRSPLLCLIININGAFLITQGP